MANPTEFNIFPTTSAPYPTIHILGNQGTMYIGGHGTDGRIIFYDAKGNSPIIINSNNNSMVLRNKAIKDSIFLNGTEGSIILHDRNGVHSFSLHGNVSNYTGLWLGANESEGKKAGKIFIRDGNGKHSIILDGASGDIFLNNADCAEEFDVLDLQDIEPGTVMVIENEGKLRQSTVAYDKRVAGVISGAGNYKPGIVLDKRHTDFNRQSISLMGKVYCKVDADISPIEVGDLLTTSSTPGHAMKAVDPLKAFGAVIGKALRPLRKGTGLIPLLIALQ
jgi:hypothetical protein